MLLALASETPSWIGYVLTIVGMAAAFLAFVIALSVRLGDLLRLTRDTHAKVEALEKNHTRHSHLFTWLEARGFFSEEVISTESAVKPRKRTGHTNPGMQAPSADTTSRGRALAIAPLHDPDDGEGE